MGSDKKKVIGLYLEPAHAARLQMIAQAYDIGQATAARYILQNYMLTVDPSEDEELCVRMISNRLQNKWEKYKFERLYTNEGKIRYSFDLWFERERKTLRLPQYLISQIKNNISI